MIHQTINKGYRTNKEGRKRFIQRYGISAQSFLHHYLKQDKNFRGHLGEAQLPLAEQLLNKIKLLKYIFQ